MESVYQTKAESDQIRNREPGPGKPALIKQKDSASCLGKQLRRHPLLPVNIVSPCRYGCLNIERTRSVDLTLWGKD